MSYRLNREEVRPDGILSAVKGAAGLALLLLAALAGGGGPAPPRRDIVLLSTTTTQDSAILKALLGAFERRTRWHVKAIVAGSGDVLRQGASGEGDVLLAHSPEAELAWMAKGYGTSRRLVMYNDFILVGPPADPAGIKGAASAAEALRRIAAHGATFVSRGDQSGTHVCERKLWKSLDIQPKGKKWYRETGQGQGLTLDLASQLGGYAISDRGTFYAHRKRLELALLYEKDARLLNVYHVLTVDPKRFPRVDAEGGRALADFLVSQEGQRVIGEFGKAEFGEPLFVPAAGLDESKLAPRR
jgi:tungstate transport system substrate-binding protein